MRVLLGCLMAGTALLAGPASATIYNVDLSVGSVGKITGTITTNSNTGLLSASDILSWNLDVLGNGSSLTLDNTNSGVFTGGNALSATATALSFDFGAATPSYLLFQESYGSGTHYACAASTTSTPCYQGLSAVPQSYNDSTPQYTGQGAGGSLAGKLTIGAAVPEPATWALMLLGVGAVGFALRRRTERTVSVRYA